MAELPDHAVKTVADFQSMIEKMERETNHVKNSVNMLCRVYGVEPMYEVSETNGESGTKAKSIELKLRPDEFFGKPLATAVREVLNSRKASALGPIDPRELFEVLQKGGFAFDQRDDSIAFRVMQISISKNTAAFVRLPNEQIGLVEWYPAAQRSKARAAKQNPSAGTVVAADAGGVGAVSTSGEAQIVPPVDGMPGIPERLATLADSIGANLENLDDEA